MMAEDKDSAVEVVEGVFATHLRAECGVRYWEDGYVDGVIDVDGTLIPCRQGDDWVLMVELATGRIANWREGCRADVHYKVCDDGKYALLHDEAVVVEIAGYVPDILRTGVKTISSNDYVILTINEEGFIDNWSLNFREFRKEIARSRTAGDNSKEKAAASVPDIVVQPLYWIECEDGSYHDIECQYEIIPQGSLWLLTRGVTGGSSYVGNISSLEQAKKVVFDTHSKFTYKSLGLPAPHFDDIAVDRFANSMKKKAIEKTRSGIWGLAE